MSTISHVNDRMIAAVTMPPISDLRRWSVATGQNINPHGDWNAMWRLGLETNCDWPRAAIAWIAANPAPAGFTTYLLRGKPCTKEEFEAATKGLEYKPKAKPAKPLRTFPSSRARARVPDELIPARMACISADMRMGVEWWARRP